MGAPQVIMIVFFVLILVGAGMNAEKEDDSRLLLIPLLNIAILSGLMWWGGFWS